ncbi:hypothetical protein CW304_25445 [Bacillus sp. UFRGS-B20]|nr:hypothetical protein CW304_25445 [Bacillus sp. UFRGS-B20]
MIFFYLTFYHFNLTIFCLGDIYLVSGWIFCISQLLFYNCLVHFKDLSPSLKICFFLYVVIFSYFALP